MLKIGPERARAEMKGDDTRPAAAAFCHDREVLRCTVGVVPLGLGALGAPGAPLQEAFWGICIYIYMYIYVYVYIYIYSCGSKPVLSRGSPPLLQTFVAGPLLQTLVADLCVVYCSLQGACRGRVCRRTPPSLTNLCREMAAQACYKAIF